jgi:CRP-like cAMP-binding protein
MTAQIHSTFQGSTPVSLRSSPAQEDIAALQRIALKARWTRNQTIFNDGDPAEHAYKVVSGVVRLCKHTPDGRRQVAAFRLPGEYFGFMEYGDHTFTAEAVTDVVLMSHPQTQLENLLEQRPGVRRQFHGLMAQRLAELQEQVVLLGRQTAMERVSSLLLTLSQRTGSEDDNIFDVPMSRQDMADYLGLTIETVCRAISDLKKDRVIIAITAQQFRLANGPRMRQLAAQIV